MRVNLPKTSARKLEFHEVEFSLVLTRIVDPNADPWNPIPIAYNPYENWIEVDDEHGITEENIKDAYKKFKHDETWKFPDWKKRMRELYLKEDNKVLTDEEELELQKLERRERKERLGLRREDS